MSHLVLGPWKVIFEARRRGRPAWLELQGLWEASAGGTGGPMHAARVALEWAGTYGSLDEWGGPRGRMVDPMLQPEAGWRDYLLGAVEARQLAELARKRTDFAGAAWGLDGWQPYPGPRREGTAKGPPGPELGAKSRHRPRP